MSRDPARRIVDALEAIERCQRYVAALNRDTDIAEMAEYAIERNLQSRYELDRAEDAAGEQIAAITPLKVG